MLLGIGLMAIGFLAAAAVSGTNSEPQPVSPPDDGAALAPDVVTRLPPLGPCGDSGRLGGENDGACSASGEAAPPGRREPAQQRGPEAPPANTSETRGS